MRIFSFFFFLSKFVFILEFFFSGLNVVVVCEFRKDTYGVYSEPVDPEEVCSCHC